jgi:hypothetical protein
LGVQDVEKIVACLSPGPVCDTCLTTKLGISLLEHADHAARELAGTNGYERRKDACCLCDETAW